MTTDAPDPLRPIFVTVGANDARVFGMAAAERARALAAKAGIELADAPVLGRASIVADLAYTWDPAWLSEIVSAGRGSISAKIRSRASSNMQLLLRWMMSRGGSVCSMMPWMPPVDH